LLSSLFSTQLSARPGEVARRSPPLPTTEPRSSRQVTAVASSIFVLLDLLVGLSVERRQVWDLLPSYSDNMTHQVWRGHRPILTEVNFAFLSIRAESCFFYLIQIPIITNLRRTTDRPPLLDSRPTFGGSRLLRAVASFSRMLLSDTCASSLPSGFLIQMVLSNRPVVLRRPCPLLLFFPISPLFWRGLFLRSAPLFVFFLFCLICTSKEIS